MPYDSYDNVVSGNDLGGNDLNTGGTHTTMGDLSLNALLGLTNGNTIENNVILSDSPIAPAVFELGSNNIFTSNVIESLAGAPLFDWDGTISSDTSYWSQTVSSTDKFSGVPLTAPPAGVTPSFLFPAGL